jgi:AcrR family transcriptional regulator
MGIPSPRARARPYHHGDLPQALLSEAERILERDGLQGLTLRAIARAAGVSHTAPQNHFGDLTGLLSELAALGFRRFAGQLDAAAQTAGGDRATRNRSTARAYLAFARRHPGLFTLMFRSERLDPQRPALRAAIAAARAALAATSAPPTRAAAPRHLVGAGAARWSLVHGFAVLLVEGRFDGMMQMVPGGLSPDALFEAMLDCTRIAPPESAADPDRPGDARSAAAPSPSPGPKRRKTRA